MTLSELAKLLSDQAAANTSLASQELSYKDLPLVGMTIDSKGGITIATDTGPDDDPPEPVRKKCPYCGGPPGVVKNPNALPDESPWMPCTACNGTGYVDGGNL